MVRILTHGLSGGCSLLKKGIFSDYKIAVLNVNKRIKERSELIMVWVILFHVVGLVFWIGGLLVVTAMLGQHAMESSPEAGAALGLAEMRMLKGMANPGAVITIVTGILLVYTRPAYYLHVTWFQAKAILVICLIVLHAMTYSRTSRFVRGQLWVPRKNWMILHGAISLVFLGILVCVLPGRLYWR